MSSLPFAALAESGGFRADERFRSHVAEPLSIESHAQVLDPIAAAYQEGFVAGHTAASEELTRQQAERDDTLATLAVSLARIDEACVDDLREKLRQTVLELCEQAVLPLAIDPDGLMARIETAIGMLRREGDSRILVLHPKDRKLLAKRLPEGLEVTEDDTLERGSIRIDSDNGGVEDGPAQWRRLLQEAFATC